MSSTYFFRLEFPKIDLGHPISPECKILARHDGVFRSLTAKLVEAEFGSCIDQLIKELEDIRQEGKRRFIAAEKSSKEHYERSKRELDK